MLKNLAQLSAGKKTALVFSLLIGSLSLLWLGAAPRIGWTLIVGGMLAGGGMSAFGALCCQAINEKVREDLIGVLQQQRKARAQIEDVKSLFDRINKKIHGRDGGSQRSAGRDPWVGDEVAEETPDEIIPKVIGSSTKETVGEDEYHKQSLVQIERAIQKEAKEITKQTDEEVLPLFEEFSDEVTEGLAKWIRKRAGLEEGYIDPQRKAVQDTIEAINRFDGVEAGIHDGMVLVVSSSFEEPINVRTPMGLWRVAAALEIGTNLSPPRDELAPNW